MESSAANQSDRRCKKWLGLDQEAKIQWKHLASRLQSIKVGVPFLSFSLWNSQDFWRLNTNSNDEDVFVPGTVVDVL